jgi:hypothetical protein
MLASQVNMRHLFRITTPLSAFVNWRAVRAGWRALRLVTPVQ